MEKIYIVNTNYGSIKIPIVADYVCKLKRDAIIILVLLLLHEEKDYGQLCYSVIIKNSTSSSFYFDLIKYQLRLIHTRSLIIDEIALKSSFDKDINNNFFVLFFYYIKKLTQYW